MCVNTQALDFFMKFYKNREVNSESMSWSSSGISFLESQWLVQTDKSSHELAKEIACVS